MSSRILVLVAGLSWGASAAAGEAPRPIDLELLRAAESGDVAAVEAQLALGADPNALAPTGHRALAIAAFRGHPAVVRSLLDHGADIDGASKSGHALPYTAAQGQTEAVQALIFAGASPDVSSTTGSRYAALHTASVKGHAGTVAELLRLGADVDQKDAGGKTALDLAKAGGHTAAAAAIERHLAERQAMRAPLPAAPGATRLPAGSDLMRATQDAASGAAFVLEAGEYAGPLVAQGKRLTVVGDAAGKTVIAGTEKFAGAVVVADAKADLTLADVGFRTVNDKQAAVMVRQSSARLVGCRFESLKDYAVYVEGGDVIVSRGTFTAVASLGVAAFKESTVRVFESTFSDGKRSALHAQDGSTLAVEACRFGKLREAAVVGLKGSTVRVHGSRFDAVANAAIAVQGASLAVIRHNAFSACRAVADCDGTAELIVSGNTVDGGPEDDGVRLRPAGPTAITDNAFRGVQTAVAVTGATSAPVAIARNTAVSMRRGGIYLSGGSEGVTARLYHNRILGFPKVGLLLDEEVRAVMVGNAVIADAGEAMAASIQNGASILASGNILVADQAAASFYQSDAAVSRFDDDLLFGPVLAGDRRPLLGPMTRRLDVLLREDAARAELATAVEEYRSQPADRRDSALSSLADRIAALRARTADLAEVTLEVEDSIGVRRPRPLRIFAADDTELEEALASAPAGDPAIVPPGRYWAVSGEESDVSEIVDVEAGRRREAVIRVDRSLWLTFRVGKDGEQKILLRMRPAEAIVAALPGLRRQPLVAWDDAMRRPEATAEQLAAARQAALAVLPELIRKQAPLDAMTPEQRVAYWADRGAKAQFAYRILNVSGLPEDIDAMTRWGRENDEPSIWRRIAETAVRIEARHGELANGRLSSWLAGDHPGRAVAAACALYEQGDRRGAGVLRGAVSEPNPLWTAYVPAWALLGAPEAATLDAMRKLLAAAGKDPTPNATVHGGVHVPASLCLLAHGGPDDWKMVAAATLGAYHADAFMLLARDPLELARYLADVGRGRMVRQAAISRVLDRPEAEARYFRDQVNAMLAGRAVGDATYDRERRERYSSSLNTSLAMQTFYEPWIDAVAFYGPFGNNQALVPAENTQDSLSVYLSWFVEPSYLDLYLTLWRKGNLAFQPQLDFIDWPAIEKAGGDAPPPAWDLYRSYRQVATQQYLQRHLDFSTGAAHFPYVTRYMETNADGGKEWGGGLSGVADVRAEWRDATLRIAVRLRQQSYYNDIGSLAGMIGRGGDKGNWPHHRYTLDRGRSLIDRIVVRRGPRAFEASDTGVVEDGWMIFRAEMDDDRLDELWLDVRCKFLDQELTFIDSLSFGEQARRMREARGVAAEWATHSAADPDDTDRLWRWGNAELSAGRLAAGARAYRRALAADPTAEDPWADAARMLADRDGAKLAIDLLADGLKANPASAYLAGEIARTHYGAGEYAAAAVAAERARELAPDDPPLAFTHGACLLLAGRIDAADPVLAAVAADFAPEHVAMLRYIIARSSEAIPDGDSAAALAALREKLDDERQAWRLAFDVLTGDAAVEKALEQARDAADRCRLHLAAGYRELFGERREGAVAQLGSAVATQRRDLLEWRLADAALRRIRTTEASR